MLNLITNFLKNIKYLFCYSLKDREKENMYQTLLRTEEMIEFGEVTASKEIPQILDFDQTLDLLISTKKSFCRIGDGEIEIIMGNDTPFQTYNERLADYLKHIISDSSDDYYVGINYHYFHSTKPLNDINRRFYLTYINKYREYLLENCNKKRTYISAGFNQVYVVLREYDYATHFNKIIKLLQDEDIVLFCGDRVFNNIDHNVFDFANSVEYIHCASKDAFDQFDSILDQCRKMPKTKTLAFILGQTSKALVYVLSKEGYRAWDIGHLAKDYDYYMKGKDRNSSTINEFFAAD